MIPFLKSTAYKWAYIVLVLGVLVVNHAKTPCTTFSSMDVDFLTKNEYDLYKYRNFEFFRYVRLPTSLLLSCHFHTVLLILDHLVSSECEKIRILRR